MFKLGYIPKSLFYFLNVYDWLFKVYTCPINEINKTINRFYFILRVHLNLKRIQIIKIIIIETLLKDKSLK